MGLGCWNSRIRRPRRQRRSIRVLYRGLTDSQGVKVEDISQKVDATQRSASPAEPLEQEKTKKAKKKHEGDLLQATDSQGVEFEDVSHESRCALQKKRKRSGSGRRRKET